MSDRKELVAQLKFAHNNRDLAYDNRDKAVLEWRKAYQALVAYDAKQMGEEKGNG